MDTGENPPRAWIYAVTGNYFDVLGIQPYLGRVFHGSDEHGPNSAPYIVLTHAGSAAGLLLGSLATRVLASIVYQANPRDPLVLTGVVLAMLLLGLLATWIPAQRALSVDPVTLLREE